MCHFLNLSPEPVRDFFIENPLVRIHFIIEMISWTGFAPWESEFPFPGSLMITFSWTSDVSFSACTQAIINDPRSNHPVTSFTLVIIKNKFTDLCENWFLQNDFINTFCEILPLRCQRESALTVHTLLKTSNWVPWENAYYVWDRLKSQFLHDCLNSTNQDLYVQLIPLDQVYKSQVFLYKNQCTGMKNIYAEWGKSRTNTDMFDLMGLWSHFRIPVLGWHAPRKVGD